WIDELFWGRRYVLTTGFGDLGPPALGLFALYYERRHRIVHLAREYSLVIANFGDSDHLKLEEISPATAVRRQSRVRAGGEVVARLGRPDEERERVTPPGRRTMIYRGANGNGAGQYEVAVELHDDRVREVTCVTTR